MSNRLCLDATVCGAQVWFGAITIPAIAFSDDFGFKRQNMDVWSMLFGEPSAEFLNNPRYQ